jgi:hypothetical protein
MNTFMSTLSVVSPADSKGLSRKAGALLPSTPINGNETVTTAAIEKAFPTQPRPAAPPKARAFTYFGGITEGHYTEF